MKHLIDKVCSCEYCTAIDIMFGDPTLSAWETEFLKSVARFGWQDDYSSKQKAVIERMFKTQRKRWNSSTRPL